MIAHEQSAKVREGDSLRTAVYRQWNANPVACFIGFAPTGTREGGEVFGVCVCVFLALLDSGSWSRGLQSPIKALGIAKLSSFEADVRSNSFVDNENGNGEARTTSHGGEGPGHSETYFNNPKQQPSDPTEGPLASFNCLSAFGGSRRS